MDRELLDPKVVGAAKLLGITIMQDKETAAGLNMPLLALLGLEEVPVGEIVERYVMGGGALIKPEEVCGLSTKMRNLLGWYKAQIEKKDFKHFITADVREEHYFKRYLIHIPLDKLFQLFNQCDLDKSIMSCYCL
jgi:hypothetical protein